MNNLSSFGSEKGRKRLKPTEVALSFVEAINSGKADRVAELMTPGHVFIDSDGSEHRGREKNRRGWQTYLSMVPDYMIQVTDVFERDDTVVLLGIAEGTILRDGGLDRENRWSVPAAWRVVIGGEQVAVWQLYVNPEPMKVTDKPVDSP